MYTYTYVCIVINNNSDNNNDNDNTLSLSLTYVYIYTYIYIYIHKSSRGDRKFGGCFLLGCLGGDFGESVLKERWSERARLD